MPLSRDRTYTPLPTYKSKAKASPTKVPPAGKAEPWQYGPFRVVAQRRVSEEEQLSVECYADTVEAARAYLGAFLYDFRAHMKAYNEQVVLVQERQLEQVNQMIEERGEDVRRLEREIEALTAAKQDLAHPDAGDGATDGAGSRVLPGTEEA